jgi:hypothetical protein
MNGEITQRILYSLYFELDLGKIKRILEEMNVDSFENFIIYSR